jgi:hypothetical protein
MIRHYKCIKKKQKCQEAMEDAVQCIQNEQSARSLSRKRGIPFTALQERVKGGIAEPLRLERKSIFTREQEMEIADHAKKLTNMFYGFTPTDLRL